jgi:hypothetical protein
VRLDQLVLLGAEPAGLVQDAVGQADLADVVQGGEQEDLLDVLVAQAAAGGQLPGDQPA